MEPYITRRLFGCVAVALSITACARDPKPGTPEAAVEGERLMRSMSDTLARAKAFTFETSERLEVMAPGGEKRAPLFTRKVTVRRPDALFFELHRKGDPALDIAAYYDGRTVTLDERPDGVWAQTAVPGTLDGMLDDVARRFGLPVPIGDVVYSSPYDAFIGSSTQGGFVGRETIADVSCVKLDYADAFVQVKLWLPASGPALPVRLEIDYKQPSTIRASRIDFKSWKLDVPVMEAVFAFQPPAGHRSIEFEDLVEGVVSGTVSSAQKAGEPSGR